MRMCIPSSTFRSNSVCLNAAYASSANVTGKCCRFHSERMYTYFAFLHAPAMVKIIQIVVNTARLLSVSREFSSKTFAFAKCSRIVNEPNEKKIYSNKIVKWHIEFIVFDNGTNAAEYK